MKIEIHNSIRIKGLSAIARRTGYSHTHLGRVIRGERKPGKILEAKLRKLGIKLPTWE